MKFINYENATKEDLKIINEIVNRTQKLCPTPLARMDVEMDITAVHCNCGGLRLADLLAANNSNFLHDISGIVCHLDRENIELKDCFVPRFAKKAA